MSNLTKMDAAVVALLGYAVVFAGLATLMALLIIMGKIMVKKENKTKTAASKIQSAPAVEQRNNLPAAEEAPGTAGEVKLYDTDPKDAAIIMAIVADTLSKPVNELRFISIREVKR